MGGASRIRCRAAITTQSPGVPSTPKRYLPWRLMRSGECRLMEWRGAALVVFGRNHPDLRPRVPQRPLPEPRGQGHQCRRRWSVERVESGVVLQASAGLLIGRIDCRGRPIAGSKRLFQRSRGDVRAGCPTDWRPATGLMSIFLGLTSPQDHGAPRLPCSVRRTVFKPSGCGTISTYPYSLNEAMSGLAAMASIGACSNNSSVASSW